MAMTENDKKLIQTAKALHFTQWMDIDDMLPNADSDITRNKLKVIRQFKFHREELAAGLL